MDTASIEQRYHSADRRSWGSESRFPLVDSDGVVVYKDRRLRAERRGYELEEPDVEVIEIRQLPRSSFQ